MGFVDVLSSLAQAVKGSGNTVKTRSKAVECYHECYHTHSDGIERAGRAVDMRLAQPHVMSRWALRGLSGSRVPGLSGGMLTPRGGAASVRNL